MREIQSRIAIKLEGGEGITEELSPDKKALATSKGQAAKRAQSACGYQRPNKRDLDVDSLVRVQMVQIKDDGLQTSQRSLESDIVGQEEERKMMRTIKAGFVKEQRT